MAWYRRRNLFQLSSGACLAWKLPETRDSQNWLYQEGIALLGFRIKSMAVEWKRCRLVWTSGSCWYPGSWSVGQCVLHVTARPLRQTPSAVPSRVGWPVIPVINSRKSSAPDPGKDATHIGLVWILFGAVFLVVQLLVVAMEVPPRVGSSWCKWDLDVDTPSSVCKAPMNLRYRCRQYTHIIKTTEITSWALREFTILLPVVSTSRRWVNLVEIHLREGFVCKASVVSLLLSDAFVLQMCVGYDCPLKKRMSIQSMCCIQRVRADSEFDLLLIIKND